MKEKNKKLLNNIYFLAAIITLAIVILGVTFAYFQAKRDKSGQANVDVVTYSTDSLTFSINKEISISANQFNFTEKDPSLSDESKATVQLKPNNKTNEATKKYTVYFEITSNDYTYTTSSNTPEIILSVIDPTGKEVTSINGLTKTTSGFDITTKTGKYIIADNYEITANKKENSQEWQFKVTLENLDRDQSNNAGKSFKGAISINEVA